MIQLTGRFMTASETANLATIRAYLAALEAFGAGEALARFFTDDAVQIELPNRLNPHGGRSELPTLLKRAESVPALLREQRFELVSEMAQGTQVAVEVVWSAVPFGALAVGSAMKAHLAMFFEMKNGRIVLQRNYDCFEPW
jgi:ketosteroid isomerase-like protein